MNNWWQRTVGQQIRGSQPALFSRRSRGRRARQLMTLPLAGKLRSVITPTLDQLVHGVLVSV